MFRIHWGVLVLKRIFHPYTKWECFKSGMWRQVSSKSRAKYLAKAIEFTGNAELYGSFMLKVIRVWPITCEHHLSETGSNRKAFIGHAAATMAIDCPEDITRQAWGHLSQKQQYDANEQARIAIEIWETMQNEIQNRNLLEQMDAARVQQRHTRNRRPKARVIEQGTLISCDL